jgi:Na+/proline symporter
MSERAKVWTARCGVIGFGLVAYVIALGSEGILELVETASAFGSSGIFVVGLFGLFSRVGGALSAYAALVTGMVVWAVGDLVLGLAAPYLLSLASAFAVYVGAAWISPRPAGS